MKKIIAFLFILAMPTLGFAFSPFGQGEEYLVHYSSETVDTNASVILLDLSDQTNFHHLNTGGFVITDIYVSVDRTGSSGVTTSTGSVKIGVVNQVDASTGSISYFYEFPFFKGGSMTSPVTDHRNYHDPNLYTKIVTSGTYYADGLTPYILTNLVTSDSTSFQTDVALPSVYGGSGYPGTGDIIATFTEATAGSYSVSIDIIYHSKR